MSQIKLSENFIKSNVKLALNEDLYPSGDITSGLIENNKIIEAKLISNQNAMIGGLLFAKTLDVHNKNVRLFRAIEAQNSKGPKP